jgi:hypothetical protein
MLSCPIMLEGGDTANSTIFPTTSVSIVARWFAVWQLENVLLILHAANDEVGFCSRETETL